MNVMKIMDMHQITMVDASIKIATKDTLFSSQIKVVSPAESQDVTRAHSKMGKPFVNYAILLPYPRYNPLQTEPDAKFQLLTVFQAPEKEEY